MKANAKLLTALVFVFLVSATACKSTKKVNNDADSEEKVLSPADLAQLRDTHKLNPDAAIVSGLIVKIEDDGEREITFEVTKLEKQGFGFADYLTKGDILSVMAGKKGDEFKEGQSVLLVISALRMPGASKKFNLEKVLAAMPG